MKLFSSVCILACLAFPMTHTLGKEVDLIEGQIDIKKIDKSIKVKPEFTSQEQKYGIVALGEKTPTLHWYVLDGKKIYLDLDSDGDLTDANEMKDFKNNGQVTFEFPLGKDSGNGKATLGISLKDMIVASVKKESTFDEAKVKVGDKLIAYVDGEVGSDPQWKALNKFDSVISMLKSRKIGDVVSFQLQRNDKLIVKTCKLKEGQHNPVSLQFRSMGSRMAVFAMHKDLLYTFVTRSDDKTEKLAHLYHVGGPLLPQMQKVEINSNKDEKIGLSLHTVYPGAHQVNLMYQTIPDDVFPEMKLIFSNADMGKEDVVKTIFLEDRCWGGTFQGSVRAPQNAKLGAFDVEVSFLKLNKRFGLNIQSFKSIGTNR